MSLKLGVQVWKVWTSLSNFVTSSRATSLTPLPRASISVSTSRVSLLPFCPALANRFAPMETASIPLWMPARRAMTASLGRPVMSALKTDFVVEWMSVPSKTSRVHRHRRLAWSLQAASRAHACPTSRAWTVQVVPTLTATLAQPPPASLASAARR